MKSPVLTIELTADGVQEVSARIRTAENQVEAAMLMQKLAPALERFDRAVRNQVHARHEAKADSAQLHANHLKIYMPKGKPNDRNFK